MTDTVNHPSHYTHPSAVECIDISEQLPSNLCKAFEYAWRAERKNGAEDIRKALWYVEREIQRRQSDTEPDEGLIHRVFDAEPNEGIAMALLYLWHAKDADKDDDHLRVCRNYLEDELQRMERKTK